MGLIAAIISFIAVVLPFFGHPDHPPTPANVTITSSADQSEIWISAPADGSEVVYGPVPVQGIAHHIPQGEYLWIIVQPVVGASQYFPQDDHVEIAKNGDTWELGAYIGKEGSADAGKKFMLWAVLADQGANATLKANCQANQTKRRVHPGADFDPLTSRPPGTQWITFITVVRK